jgi:hypothetical protein
MCWPRVGEANPLFSVYSTLCRWTATSNFINAVKRKRNLGLGARMITFHTTLPRIQPWIKVLSIFYYDNLGKQDNIKLSWSDIPETWSDRHDAANCILIEVKNLDETLKYNLTFFVTTGTIRAQGSPMASYGHLRAFPVRLFNFDGKHSRGYSSRIFSIDKSMCRPSSEFTLSAILILLKQTRSTSVCLQLISYYFCK